jgi:hypothetical protein
VFFSPVNNGLPSSRYSGKYVLSANSGGDVFAGNDSSGVYRSTDNGNHWTPVNSGLSNLNIRSIVVSPSGYVFVGTGSGLVYCSSQPTTGIELSGYATPREFLLKQNYPNPFNPATSIEFSLPQSGLVTLKIFNLLGEEVATLLNEVRPSGTYRIGWNASGSPSGVYFCQLQAGDFTETKKLILLR